MIRYAKSQGFAIPQMNINGLIWIEGVLQAAENMQSPIIIGTTDKNIAYLGWLQIYPTDDKKIKLQRWV
ncbi:6-phospho-5-dehydro-2-deoxy-D-gluconate aldolase [Staphylococcus gallinarum]|uniref:6-phospho-5-dehydro-2-deoxy-D-gluconate aldolase n=1 Tax=Staphylococcus gallinarum TaxID=1293 RepID=A0A380FD34_STAGA|nr:6-phospho-5-dehydro-2-deoxy-D-gluconate aldolase [Staphylococcus gallinarum]